MSEFGNTIKNLIPDSSSAREIALKIGVHPSAFSKFITGVRLSCNPETLEKICLGVSSKKADQAELLAAYPAGFPPLINPHLSHDPPRIDAWATVRVNPGEYNIPIDTGHEGIGSSRGTVRMYNPRVGTWTPVHR